MSDSPTTIILVRHADVHNPADVVYGRLPGFRLSTIGVEEAARTALMLGAALLTAVYSSPQLRARQTARAIAAQHDGLAMRVTNLLDEVRTTWQGVSNAEMSRIMYNFYEPPRAPGDETLAEVTARMRRWIALMRRRHAGGLAVGVSHGDPVMIARLLAIGRPVALATMRDPDFYPQKGSITRLVFRNAKDVLPADVIYEDPNHTAREALGLPRDGIAPPQAAPWTSHSEEEQRKA